MALSLAVLIASVQGAAASLDLPYVDEFVSGTVNIGIGEPSTQYTLLFDPGSSNTWVGAQKPYVVTQSSQDTGDTVSISYSSGSFSGEEYLDTVILDNTTINNQSIGAATSSTEIHDVDGILGLGPTDLTQGTVSGSGLVPTILDNLVSQGDVEAPIITIGNGIITFGSVSSADVIYTPITHTSPASNYWGLDASFSYAADSLLPTTAGIIDHGTTLILLATSGYQKFLRETGAIVDEATGLPVLSSCDGLDSIFLTLGEANITITVDNYRWPARKNTDIGGNQNKCYLAVNDLGSNAQSLHSGPGRQFRRSSAVDSQGLDFIVGFNTLKHYTVVLDGESSIIGIAN